MPAESRADRELERLAAERGKAAAKVVTMHEANLFATTRYHMPDTYVDPAAGNCLDIIYNICIVHGMLFFVVLCLASFLVLLNNFRAELKMKIPYPKN